MKNFLLVIYILVLACSGLTMHSANAQSTNAENYYRKGLDYFQGTHGYPKDYVLAVENFRLAEQGGCLKGDLFYGFCLAEGKGVAKNVKEGVKRYARAASTGDAQSLFYFGGCLKDGTGVRQNEDAAKRYFGESAKKGEPKAIKILSDKYGITDYSALSIDWRNSERFILKDNNYISPEEYLNRGFSYFQGTNGYPKDYVLAVENFKLAEQGGCLKGDLFYGFCLVEGKGVAKNVKEGVKRYARAASTGDAQSLLYFGGCLESGTGVRLNVDAAKGYFGESAKKGNPQAIKKLRDDYAISDYSGLSIDWRNSERFLDNNGNDVNPSKAPEFKWVDFRQNVTRPDYTFKVGIKSPSQILNYNVYVNGTLTRGIRPVVNDGYDFVINPTVRLGNGKNTITVSVGTSTGNYTSQNTVMYSSGREKVVTSQKRIALVIGNANYIDPSHSLHNPVNDADDIASRLSSLGFNVTKATDLGQRETENIITRFGKEASEADVALFYYAGHSISKNGENYIIPTDAVLPSAESVKYKCVNVNMALDVLDSSGCPMKILILDACRNNPFARSWHRSFESNGLSSMNAPKGTFISFSTAPGEIAVDGLPGERNSPYAKAFLKTLNKKGLSINDFFQDILNQVCVMTNERQTPWISSSFRGNFIFNNQ